MASSERWSLLLMCCVFAACGPGATTSPSKLTALASGSSGELGVELLTEAPLVAGQNRVFYRLTQAGAPLVQAQLEQEPSHPCPMHEPSPNADGLWEGVLIFPEPSSPSAEWSLAVKVQREPQAMSERVELGVVVVGDSSLVKLVMRDGRKLLVSLSFARPPHVGANEVVLSVHESTPEYVALNDVAFQLTTEMWSMGHGVVGNVSPTRAEDGSYRGTAVFSMSGDWVLRLQVLANGADLGVFEFAIEL